MNFGRLKPALVIVICCAFGWRLFVAFSSIPSFKGRSEEETVSEALKEPPTWLQPYVALHSRYLSGDVEHQNQRRPPLMYSCTTDCSGLGDRYYYVTISFLSAVASRRPFFAFQGYPENSLLYYTPRYFAWNATTIPTPETQQERMLSVPIPGLTTSVKQSKWKKADLFKDSKTINLEAKFKYGPPILQNQEEFSLSVGGPTTEIDGQLFYALFRPTELVYQTFLTSLESLAWQLDIVDRGTLASDFLDEPKFRYFFFEEFGRDPSHRRTFGEIFVEYGNPEYRKVEVPTMEYGNPEYRKVEVPQLVGIQSRTRPHQGFENFGGIRSLNFNNTALVVPCAKQLAPTVLDPTRKIAYFCASDSPKAKSTQQEQGCITLETTAKPQHINHPRHSLNNAAAGVAEMIMLSVCDMLVGSHSGYVAWAKFINYVPTSHSFHYPPFEDIQNCSDLENRYSFKELGAVNS